MQRTDFSHWHQDISNGRRKIHRNWIPNQPSWSCSKVSDVWNAMIRRNIPSTQEAQEKPDMSFMLFLASWWPGSEMAGSGWLVHTKGVLLGCPSVLLSHLRFIPLSLLDRVYFGTNVAPYHISFCHVRVLCWRAFRSLFVSSTSS